MSIDKKMNYEIQAGVKNYKPSEMVTVPKTAKSSPTHPTAHLAYITDKEKKLLIKQTEDLVVYLLYKEILEEGLEDFEVVEIIVLQRLVIFLDSMEHQVVQIYLQE